ncbi:MAG: transaldolase, partial [Chlamydiota bacterium]
FSKFSPQDSTTNPSLVYISAQNPEYSHLVEEAIAFVKNKNQPLLHILDKLFVNFGKEILKKIPGRVSIEVDPKLSYDTKKTIERAKSIISLFEQENIPKERLLIKIASTWEGIQAASVLEQEGIHCNLTLLFSLSQAIACAEANVTIISPFVGRILDWYKKNKKQESYLPQEDPGVLFVTEIYNYYKKFDYPTHIMGASFRNKEEILELAGCDLLTISPKLLSELQNTSSPIVRKLHKENAKKSPIEKISMEKSTFLSMLEQNLMASEKLQEGIRLFTQDLSQLESLIEKRL